MQSLRLPRKIADEPGIAQLPAQLAARSRLLWAGGDLGVPDVEVEPGLVDALKSAQSEGQILRGLENATRSLTADELGLRSVDRKADTPRGGRVSRLLVVTNDGSERFYRNVESLLRRHAPRVLALRLTTDEAVLGELLFGRDQRARLLLADHKDAVSVILLTLAAQWKLERETPGDGGVES